MSEGPIKAWRDSWKPPKVSTPQSKALHAAAPEGMARAYCGRRSIATTRVWSAVTCADCIAARQADDGATS